MKTKLVMWGKSTHNDTERKVLVGLELRPENNRVITWLCYPDGDEAEKAYFELMSKWKEAREEVEMPEGTQSVESELSTTAQLLPDGVVLHKPENLERAKNEWMYTVLSSKFYQEYSTKIQEFHERIDQNENFDPALWAEVKSLWERISEQMRERNLLREHSDKLRDAVNQVFNRIKALRAVIDSEFLENAKRAYAQMSAVLDDIEARLETATDLFPMFEQLRELQREYRQAQLPRDMRNSLWTRLDGAFKAVKEKRQGGGPADERLTRRIEGLRVAVEKMDRSVQRDQQELDFQKSKVAGSYVGQLEAQLREAKVRLLQDKVQSKEEKLRDMRNTLLSLENKLRNIQKRRSSTPPSTATTPSADEQSDQMSTASDEFDLNLTDDGFDDDFNTSDND